MRSSGISSAAGQIIQASRPIALRLMRRLDATMRPGRPLGLSVCIGVVLICKIGYVAALGKKWDVELVLRPLRKLGFE